MPEGLDDLYEKEEAAAKAVLGVRLRDERALSVTGNLAEVGRPVLTLLEERLPGTPMAALTGALFGVVRQFPGGSQVADPLDSLRDDRGEMPPDIDAVLTRFQQAVLEAAGSLRAKGVLISPDVAPEFDALAQMVLGRSPDEVEVVGLGGWSEDGSRSQHNLSQTKESRHRVDQMRDNYWRGRTGFASPSPSEVGRRGGNATSAKNTTKMQTRRDSVRDALAQDPTIRKSSNRSTARELYTRWDRLSPGVARPSLRTIESDLAALFPN